MTRKEFTDMLIKEIKPNTEIDFLLIGCDGHGRFMNAFMKPQYACNHSYIDCEEKLKTVGGVVFKIVNDMTVIKRDKR